ncbi:molybdopterin-binding protein [Desulfurivibrio alkaliphilus]|uniref:Molybdopterin molybdenumtransferase n=1 Tax=Desulfurivibrio alkaliphilus (strain DSM 19089 / UNIQEM U267 / AHT2) TaxID=589865 RepID=D6Z0M7_DESAT|nr:molybdopterin-binding protein [Desulfurivibrio alkaliphilus]ADH85256.1 molybdopterin binding domain protein [Desulfurivibrio alkaliphilus AHT 2]
MAKTVPVAQAVGMVLPHDITEIRQGEFKGRAFRKGHIIRAEDIEHLKRLGKEHVYILELGHDEIHEDEAAQKLAAALAGSGIMSGGEPVEGKIGLCAAHDGLLRVDQEALYRFNLLGEVMCATLHHNTQVKAGQQVAATRLIPLVGKRQVVDEAVALADNQGLGAVRVEPLRTAAAGLVITGNEVYHGRIKDAFEPVLREKLAALGSEVIAVRKAPDDAAQIAAAIGDCLAAGADLIVTSGGMSVDPDDVTREGIARAGTREIAYGTPVLPGAMFLVGYLAHQGKEIPVLGLPACGMFHRTTVFDLLLPRILVGEKIDRRALARMGHGGLCLNCKHCLYPVCPFGK